LRGGARGADAVYGGLVEVEDEGVGHVVVFVVGIEYYVRVGFEFAGDGFPEGFEAGGVGYDVAVVASCGVLVDGVRIEEDKRRIGRTKVLSTDSGVAAPWVT
jgi:hypothetical protein